jgi:sporulation protein YlmC with PRC-barrel domain
MFSWKAIIGASVSALAIMSLAPSALSADGQEARSTMGAAESGLAGGAPANNPDTPPAMEPTPDEIKRSLDMMGEGAADTATGIAQIPLKAYRDLRAQLKADDNNISEPVFPAMTSHVVVDLSRTASSIIGSQLEDTSGRDSGMVQDIIMSEDGMAEKLIVRDGGFFGFGGKLVALDYAAVANPEPAGGEAFMPVNESVLDKVAEYDPMSERTGPAASTLFGTELRDPKGEALAKVDDIVLSGARAEYFIIVFNDVLGIGGDEAVISYNEANLMSDETGTYIQLSQHQADVLRSLKAERNEAVN